MHGEVLRIEPWFRRTVALRGSLTVSRGESPPPRLRSAMTTGSPPLIRRVIC